LYFWEESEGGSATYKNRWSDQEREKIDGS
jgi:hypothetical protein